MKRLLLLISIAVCAPIAHAQEATLAPMASAESAQIDPAARDLLARVAARHQKLQTFEYLTINQPGPSSMGRAWRSRVQLTREGKLVLGVAYNDESWRKWIYDGKTLVEFRSEHPKRYLRKSIEFDSDLPINQKLEAILSRLDVGQFDTRPFSMMVSDYPARALLLPDLAGIEMQIEGKFRVISIRRRASQPGFSSSVVKLWIDPLNLQMKRSEIFVDDKLYSTEIYQETRFNPNFGADLFRAAAPEGYKLIVPFDGEVLITIGQVESLQNKSSQ